ncbi:MAG: intradiol ring-cleavage dioxygenase [Microbacteriaceae bacterium]
MPNRVPTPEETPDGPAYEGRLLDHPDEDVVDQGVRFDMRTIVNRRTVLGLVGLGAGATVLAACASSSSSSSSSSDSASSSSGSTSSSGTTSATTAADELPDAEIPDETAGPYPADGSNTNDSGETVDILEESGIVRSDITTSIGSTEVVEGVPLSFSLTLTDMANDDAPFANAAVYAWHCNHEGLYSMYSEGVESETFLRGVQVADADGVVTFTSKFPACYSGRWPHIHFEVYPDLDSITDSTNAIATSQMTFPEDVLNDVYALDAYDGSSQNLSQVTLATDNVFSDDSAALQTATISGDTTSGYVSNLVVRIDTETATTAGSVPSGSSGAGH